MSNKIEINRYVVIAQEPNRKTVVDAFASYKSILDALKQGENDVITLLFGKKVINTVTILDLKYLLHVDFSNYSTLFNYCNFKSKELKEPS